MLTTKHDDPNKKLGWGERLAYGSGGFAFNMINGIIGSFLTIYFTSAAGLNAGIIATILAVSKIFDGVSDLIMGRIVDRTNTKDQYKDGKGESMAAPHDDSLCNLHDAAVLCTKELPGRS